MFGSRILILVPHPDDEVVACCAAIGRAQLWGAKVFALYLTHGCIAQETMWPWQRRFYQEHVARRLCEAEDVAALLGLTPVGFSERPARHLWRNLANVAQEIQASVAAYDIDQLWVPAYEGGNADHDGLNALCAKMKASLPPMLEFSEYNFSGGKAHSQDFPTSTQKEKILHLSALEKTLKAHALHLYASEACNLGYVKTEHETYRPLATYDYTKPPHEGPLWYARFQWVPFKHPRVDFTTSAELCAALSSFEPSSDLPESATPEGPAHRSEDRGTAE